MIANLRSEVESLRGQMKHGSKQEDEGGGVGVNDDVEEEGEKAMLVDLRTQLVFNIKVGLYVRLAQRAWVEGLG